MLRSYFAIVLSISNLFEAHLIIPFRQAPAVAFAQKGYHILLEKPMAVSSGKVLLITNISKNTFGLIKIFFLFLYNY